jgi:hypothetical protein
MGREKEVEVKSIVRKEVYMIKLLKSLAGVTGAEP